MPKRSPATILAEIAEAKKTASIDITNVRAANRGGISIAKADAEVKLKALREEFVAQLTERVASIFVVGAPADLKQFGEIAADQGAIVIFADAMYEKMAADIEPTIGAQRMFGGTQVQHLIRSLEDCGRYAGLGFLKVPRLLDVVVTKPPESEEGPHTVDVVKDLISSQVGPELNTKWLEASIANAAVEDAYDSRIITVVVLCTKIEDAKLIKPKLFSGFGIGVTIDEGQSVDLATVKKAFEQLEEKLGKKQ